MNPLSDLSGEIKLVKDGVVARLGNVGDPVHELDAVNKRTLESFNSSPEFSRETMGNANYIFSAGKTEVALTAALTTPRTLTFPAASSFPAGALISFVDEIQGVSNTNNLTLTRAGADTINGNTTLTIYQTGAKALFMSDGISKWTGGVDTTASNGILSTWIPTFTGFSADPTGVQARYTILGKLVFFNVTMTVGTSNATTMTMSGPPIIFSSTFNQASIQRVMNNGVWAAGLMFSTLGTNTINFTPTPTGGAFTASGSKGANISCLWEID